MNKKFNSSLARYFFEQPMYLDIPTQKKPNTRKLVEQPWQQTKAEMWDEVTDSLCNLDFIQAKASAKMTYELVNDFNTALEVIPDNQKNIKAEKARQARMDRYTKDLIAYAKDEIKELEVPESITPWSKERTEEEIESIRINPDRADKLRDFSHFIGAKAAILQKYASEYSHLTYQEAWHFANDGPVGKSAEEIPSEIRKILLLCDQNSRPTWNPLPQTLKILFTLKKSGSSGVCSVAITPDGKQAISGYWDECIHWNLSTGEVIKTMEGTISNTAILNFLGKWVYPKSEGHTSKISTISITPDGKLGFSGSWDKTCILWDLPNGKVLQTLKGHSDFINVVSITPDGRWAISGSNDKTCILWDLKTGGEPKILQGHLSRVKSVSITPDGKRAISVSDDLQDNCILWNLENGEKLRTLRTYSNMINKVYITHDGKRAICLGFRCLIWFDLITGEVLQTIKGFINFFGEDTSFTPDGKRALSVSKDNTCILWDLTTGKELLTLCGHTSYVYAVSITPDGRFGISGSNDNTCILWDLEKGKTLPGINDQKLHLRKVSITQDGKLAFFGSSDSQNDSSCTLWDLEKGLVQRTIPENAELVTRIPGIKLSSNVVSAVSIAPNGQRGISGSRSAEHPGIGDNAINIYDLLKGKLLQTLTGHTSSISDVSMTDDGRFAISSSEDETCILWDLVIREKLRTFKGHGFDVTAVYRGQGRVVDKICLVPDGKLAIFSTSGAGCKIWNLQKGESLLNIDTPMGKAVSLTPDGKWAISITQDNSCIVWNLKTGRVSRILKGHSSLIHAVSVSPDCKRAITGSGDGTSILWDLENGKILSSYISASSVESVQYILQGIFLGCEFGEILILHADRKLLCPGVAVTTIRQIWDFELNRYTNPIVYCPLCGHRFEPSRLYIETIMQIMKEVDIKPDQSPCLDLPDEAWENPALIGECPNCRERLKFNPFIAGGN
jgi:WD40 repeat protein